MEIGLFMAGYQIGGQMPGAPTFTLHLAVCTPEKTVSGSGVITQAINPPLRVVTHLNGQFTYMTVMPKNTHILVVATGYPVVSAPAGVVIPPNVELRMVLSEDWQSGTAMFSYLDNNGQWHEISDAPVKLIDTITQ